MKTTITFLIMLGVFTSLAYVTGLDFNFNLFTIGIILFFSTLATWIEDEFSL
jgi:hypothetical protein